MIKNILELKIKDAIKSNKSLKKYLKDNYNPDDVESIIINNIEDYLLSKEDVYNFSNFRELFYGVILDFEDSRLANFIRNVLTGDPKENKTYKHILNDITGKLEETYTIPNSYLRMKRSELDQICDDLITNESYFELKNVRNFIKDNFRVHDYGSYIKENRDLALKILKTVDSDDQDRVYVRLKRLLSKNMGYIGLFTYFNKIEKIPFATLQRLYVDILKKENILDLLPERVINYMRHKLPYKTPDGRTYTKHFERLTDDLTKIDEIHKAKLFADEYPINLRKGLLDNPDFIEIIKELTSSDSKSVEKLNMYRTFFLKKIARYKTQDELIDSLSTFVFAMNDDENIEKKVKDSYYSDMVYNDGVLMVIRVRNHDDIQKFGSDTSWCIKDSLSYWTDYVGDNTVQLVIIDLKEPKASVYRKIGATLNNYGYKMSFKTAHLKNDSYISEANLNARLEKYQITLQDLFDIGRNFGANQYYDSQELIDDRYGGGF